MNIFLGNLNFRTSESQIKELFADYQSLTSVKMIKDRETGKFKGFAFVEIENDDEAREAISKLNGVNFEGRDIVVNEARPQPERERRY